MSKKIINRRNYREYFLFGNIIYKTFVYKKDGYL